MGVDTCILDEWCWRCESGWVLTGVAKKGKVIGAASIAIGAARNHCACYLQF